MALNTPAYALEVTNVGETAISVSWQIDETGVDGTRVLWRQDGETSWTGSSADLSPSTKSYQLTGLLHGQKYDIAVESFAGDETMIDVVIDVPTGTTESVASGETKTVDSAYRIMGSVEVAGSFIVQDQN